MRYLFALCAAANALPPALPPFALEGVITTARDFAAATPLQAPTGLTRSSYLPVIAGIVEHFRHLQDAAGAIIDQYRNVETQYATPCFAFACATVVANGGDQTLLPNCTAALSRSIEELATGTCADGHCAFFGKPVVFAYRILSALVAPGVAAGWRAGLAQLNPWKDYGFPSGNWGLVAAVGEFMRASVLGADANTTWFEDMLKFQLGGQGHDQSYSYTPNGLYEDHSGDAGLNPLPYDTFPSSGYLTVLLHEGYNGTFAPIISELMQRAVWSHLLMQSPSGEIPTGGRSSQHNWNEAVSAIAYEAYAATTLAAGDAGAACMFKRAARKSLASVSRWQNPGGELQIVKNHVDAAQRWGYEGYSFQSNYNLLPAAMLSAAFAYATPATEALGECTTFSDVGGFVFQLPEHHLVIANAGGVYVEVETGADPHYESTGLHRVHVDTCGAQPAPGCVALRGVLGPTASPPIGPSAEAPPQVTGGGVAVGAFWVRGGVTTALANMTFQDVSGVALAPLWNDNSTTVRFTIFYYLLGEGVLVTETYTLQAAPTPYVELTVAAVAESEGALRAHAAARRVELREPPPRSAAAAAAPQPISAFGVTVPALVWDGARNLSVTTSGSTLEMAGPAGWGVQRVVIIGPPRNISWAVDVTDTHYVRNGLMAVARAQTASETSQPTVTLMLQPANA